MVITPTYAALAAHALTEYAIRVRRPNFNSTPNSIGWNASVAREAEDAARVFDRIALLGRAIYADTHGS